MSLQSDNKGQDCDKQNSHCPQPSQSEANPLKIWQVVALGSILVVAGSILGQGGLFDYQQSMPLGYQTRKAPGDEGDPPQAIEKVLMREGKSVYTQKCALCHMADGKGDGINYPPLAGSEWVTGPTARFSQIVQHGLSGPIPVGGKNWGVQAMPAQGPLLNDRQMAAVMTYVRNSFGNSTKDVVTVEMVKNARGLHQGAVPMTVDLLKAYDKDLEGTKIPWGTPVNPVTLKPAK